jgi:AcrR family transcriptional regulator
MYDARMGTRAHEHHPLQGSELTRDRLVQAALDSLVDRGFARTTGMEVCRRAGLTRGALNHHFPDFADLLVAALGEANRRVLERSGAPHEGTYLQRWVYVAHERLSQREYKAVIELWLAARNDPSIGTRLGAAVEDAASLFRPDQVIRRPVDDQGPLRARFYRLASETLIGLALGRASRGGEPLGHESATVEMLAGLGRALDEGTLGPVLEQAMTTEEKVGDR